MLGVQLNKIVEKFGAIQAVHGTDLKVKSKDRAAAMVIQNSALYPNPIVAENIAFGLEICKIPKGESKEPVVAVGETLGLTEDLERRPADLSGGQRHPFAMGRAIVHRPEVSLFDETRSNLDAKLRTQMRAELKQLHKRLDATSIYVTHDQAEAITSADRIVVMCNGRIGQNSGGVAMPIALDSVETLGSEALLHSQVDDVSFVPKVQTHGETPHLKALYVDTSRIKVFGIKTGRAIGLPKNTQRGRPMRRLSENAMWVCLHMRRKWQIYLLLAPTVIWFLIFLCKPMYGLQIAFPIPIILALAFNEFVIPGLKKTAQTIVYLPHFISTVVLVFSKRLALVRFCQQSSSC
ncbi:ATP-binding cassette domain-containing protein [Falsihalocynthiibacter sp. BN13B15]|uniref:ATP-binding cassette domain-containing protein n=1 Tax=Falsihalocynthiibacter sp. BN13B15 TaxID=3240871 RepID=UPI00350F659D